TEQVCPVGLVFTVTLYALPLASAVANVNVPLALTVRLSPPLSCSTTVPDSPDTLPPTVYVVLLAVPPDQLSTWPVPKDMMPGAPPVKLVSVAEIRTTPFCKNEIVEPTAMTCSLVPGG